MKNFVQPGDAVTVVFPYIRTSGQGVLIAGSLFGIAVTDVASGATGTICREGVFSSLPKATGAGQAFTVGQRLYWDDSGKQLTATSTGNVAVGIALAAVATGVATAGDVSIEPSTPAGT